MEGKTGTRRVDWSAKTITICVALTRHFELQALRNHLHTARVEDSLRHEDFMHLAAHIVASGSCSEQLTVFFLVVGM